MSEVVLVFTTVTAGLVAGLFFGFWVSVMPALRQVEDHVFVDVMQRINRVIQNPMFGVVFGGSLLGSAALLVLEVAGDGVDWLVVLGSVVYLVSMAVTIAGNVPLNNALEAAGTEDPESARAAFEARWTGLNRLRGLLSTVAVALYVSSLL